MTFLKRLGQVLAKIATVAIGVGPIIQPFVGSGKTALTVSAGLNDLTSIGTIILQIETALQGKTGADKFAAALPLVGNIIKTSELVIGKKIADADKFQLAVSEYTQATVDLLNSIHDSEVKLA